MHLGETGRWVFVLALCSCLRGTQPPAASLALEALDQDANVNPASASRVAIAARDSDGDGVPDESDQCPTEPEDCDGFQDADGCHDLDNDGDGIADVCDKCPREPETYNGYQDDDGCPDAPMSLLPASAVKIILTVPFEAGSARFDPNWVPRLAELVATHKKHPEFERIAIVGHASPDERNAERLSAARATEVLRTLVKLGMPSTMLEAHGAAARSPAAEGVGASRRVEFNLLRVWGKIINRWDGKAIVEGAGYPDGPPPPARPEGMRGHPPVAGEPPRCPGRTDVPNPPHPPPGGCAVIKQ